MIARPNTLPNLLRLCAALAAASCSGCATHETTPEDALKRRERITYYDRNGDGKVDLESHRHPGMADADWQLLDEDHDGRYEKKVLFGFAVTESRVDLPVPTNVPVKRIP